MYMYVCAVKLSLGGGITARMHSPAKTRARCPLQDCDLNVPSQQKEAGTKVRMYALLHICFIEHVKQH